MSAVNKANVVAQGEEPPYISAPYPDKIVQVHEGETEGEKKVIELLNEEWPAPIKELEKMSEYTGPFIRNVLRHKFAPAPEEVEDGNGDTAMDSEGVASEMTQAAEMMDDGEEWSRAFRAGLKLALATDLSESEASDAVGSGFIEGRQIKSEIEAEEQQ